MSKRILWLVLAAAASASVLRAQTFGFGAAVGLINDVSSQTELNGFKHSEVNGWVEYRMDKLTLLRGTYGSMRTFQSRAGSIVDTPGGSVTVPEFKERLNYWMVDASYLFWEGFYTSGLFAGIGAYQIKPDASAPEFNSYRDLSETVFGWHLGVDGELRLAKNLGLVGRFTYHNIAAHPHRQFFNMNAGLVGRF